MLELTQVAVVVAEMLEAQVNKLAHRALLLLDTKDKD
jgi:hypothetical protein